MQRLTRFCLLALFAAAMLTGGCSSKTAKTPKQAAINLVKSLKNNDRSLFLATVDITEEERDFAGQVFEDMAIIVDFSDAMKKTYGKEGYDDVNHFHLKLPSAEEIETKAVIKESGDTAVITTPDMVTLNVVRKDGIWKIPMEIASPERRERELNRLRAVTDAMKSVRGTIGKPGITPENIKQLLKKERRSKDSPVNPQIYSNLKDSLQGGEIAAAKTDIANLGMALNVFEIDCGHYPTTEEGLQALFTIPGNTNNWKGPYLEKSEMPRDPWGNPYVYRCPGQHNPNGFDLYSFGPDGQDGGGDDIDNWTKK